jgi:hypothetical protein
VDVDALPEPLDLPRRYDDEHGLAGFDTVAYERARPVDEVGVACVEERLVPESVGRLDGYRRLRAIMTKMLGCGFLRRESTPAPSRRCRRGPGTPRSADRNSPHPGKR